MNTAYHKSNLIFHYVKKGDSGVNNKWSDVLTFLSYDSQAKLSTFVCFLFSVPGRGVIAPHCLQSVITKRLRACFEWHISFSHLIANFTYWLLPTDLLCHTQDAAVSSTFI